jgi:hypothetical protein
VRGLRFYYGLLRIELNIRGSTLQMSRTCEDRTLALVASIGSLAWVLFL